MATSFGQEYLYSSFGVMSTPSLQLPNFIVSPMGIYYRIWKFFLAMLIIYSTWMFPFESLFIGKPSTAIFVTNGVANAFFLIDAMISFNVAYVDQATQVMVHDHFRIARRYAPWFVIDIGFICLGMFKTKHPLIMAPIYGLFNLVQLYRRVVSVLGRMEKDIKYSYFWVRCIKFVCVTLFAIHYSGCIFYFIAVHYRNLNKSWIGESMDDLLKQSLWTRYMTCIYLSITTLTTVGYGDLHPTNATEMLFASCYMLFNFGFDAYLVGNVADLFVHMTNQTRKFRDSIQAASRFGLCNQLPAPFQEEMYIELCRNFMHQQETFESLPRATRSNILCRCYSDLVGNVYLFHGISRGSLYQLVSEMKIEFFANNKFIFIADQAPTDIYIVVKGGAEMRFHIADNRQARVGDIFGDVGFICNQPHLFTVRTNQVSQLLRLDRTAFMNMVHSNVSFATTIVKNFLEHCRDNLTLQRVLVEVEKKLIRGTFYIPVSLCYAVERGDAVMLKNLLDKGLDPDESCNGNIALCLSASKGDDKAVTLLLENGADPNICDSRGNVPLWEAVKGGHTTVKGMLLKYHAYLKQGDEGQYACIGVQQNNLELLKEIKELPGNLFCRCRCHNGNFIPGTKAKEFASWLRHSTIEAYLTELSQEGASTSGGQD